MRVVIVGGAGFIGSELSRSIRGNGMQPVVLDTASRLAKAGNSIAGVERVAFDFVIDRDKSQLFKGCHAVVHLACTTNPADSMRKIAWDAESNIAPSIHLFDAVAQAGVKRVVFASSGGTVYGACARIPVSESDPTHPLSAYGVSKLAIENYMALYPSFTGISLRIANPYGAYQLNGSAVGVIARYVSLVAAGMKPEIWGDGSVTRDYIAIEDVISAFHHALVTDGLEPGAYNIGSGVGHSVNDVVESIFRIAGKPVEANYVQGRPYDVPEIVLDSARFMDLTSWRPGIAFETGIKMLCAAAGIVPAQNDARELLG